MDDKSDKVLARFEQVGGRPIEVKTRRKSQGERKRSIRPDDKRLSGDEPLNVVLRFRVSGNDLDRILKRFGSVVGLRDWIVKVMKSYDKDAVMTGLDFTFDNGIPTEDNKADDKG